MQPFSYLLELPSGQFINFRMQIKGKFSVMQNFPQDVNWILFASTGPLGNSKYETRRELKSVVIFRPCYLDNNNQPMSIIQKKWKMKADLMQLYNLESEMRMFRFWETVERNDKRGNLIFCCRNNKLWKWKHFNNFDANRISDDEQIWQDTKAFTGAETRYLW